MESERLLLTMIRFTPEEFVLLDALKNRMRGVSGKLVPRSRIVRALVRGALSSEMDLAKFGTEEKLAEGVRSVLQAGLKAGPEKKLRRN